MTEFLPPMPEYPPCCPVSGWATVDGQVVYSTSGPTDADEFLTRVRNRLTLVPAGCLVHVEFITWNEHAVPQ